MTASLSSKLERQGCYLSALWLFGPERAAQHGKFVIKLPNVFGENADKVRLSVRLQIRKLLSSPLNRAFLFVRRKPDSGTARLVAHGLATSVPAAAAAVHKSEVLNRKRIRWRHGSKAVPGTPNGLCCLVSVQGSTPSLAVVNH